MAITKDDVLYVAELARLELSEEEIELFTKQLGSILEYVDTLNKLDLEGVEPTAHIAPVRNVDRDDVCHENVPDDIIFDNAPEEHEKLFMVPKIIE
ncbi:MAG: Asp-tRNA(Asn)/Glu-tRNA(Gln) amidotransferase subunit GatC [Candidatus Ancaeobacter aquaticus]|nr:Asp-tRNA(Asn)/Glu-tRNA(Gln) amidotransferase subunit GatC [Candidatus Ancaeobacter aquaticus]